MNGLLSTSLVMLFLLGGGVAPSPEHTRMLFFYQEGCHWCEEMEAVVHQANLQQLFGGRVQPVRINVAGKVPVTPFEETGRALSRRYAVDRTPTILFLGEADRELLRIPGMLTKEDFEDVVCEHVPAVHAVCHERYRNGGRTAQPKPGKEISYEREGEEMPGGHGRDADRHPGRVHLVDGATGGPGSGCRPGEEGDDYQVVGELCRLSQVSQRGVSR